MDTTYLLDKLRMTPMELSLVVAFLGSAYVLKRYLLPSPFSAVPGPPLPSYLVGHFKSLSSAKTGIQFCEDITESYGGVVKLGGFLGAKLLYISDPLALHHILRDLDTWPESPFLVTVLDLVFGPGLLSSNGESHRRQRKMYNSIFTAPYIRDLTPVFYTVAHQLRDTMKLSIGPAGNSVNMMKPLTQVALEFIGQGGLGHSFGFEGRSDVYLKASKDCVPALSGISKSIPLLPFLTRIGSPSFRRKAVQYVPWQAAQRLLRIVDVMDEAAIDIYQRKKQMLHDDSPQVMEGLMGDGKDLITQMLKANVEASANDKLREEELLAQLNTLLFAGSDTTSGALARALQLLALHQDVQDKLRAEIVAARKANGDHDLDYQGIENLPFLSAVVRETLRLYPPVPHLPRVSTRDDVIPLRYPITSPDGKTQITSLPVPKGTQITVAIVSTNTSTKIWGPDATEWKPERWINPPPQSLVDAKVPGVLSTVMTFLDGGKSCIGYRFALQEMKVVLCVLLEAFKFLPDVDIRWELGFMMTPYAVGDDLQPQLPLKVQYIGE